MTSSWFSCLWSGSSPVHSPNNTKINADVYQLLLIFRAKSESSAWHETTIMHGHLLLFQLPSYSQSLWVAVIFELPRKSLKICSSLTLNFAHVILILCKTSLPLLVGFIPISGFILKTVVTRVFLVPWDEIRHLLSVHICHAVVIPLLEFKMQSAEMLFFLRCFPTGETFCTQHSAWYTIDVQLCLWNEFLLNCNASVLVCTGLVQDKDPYYIYLEVTFGSLQILQDS